MEGQGEDEGEGKWGEGERLGGRERDLPGTIVAICISYYYVQEDS